ncbi:MAG TPA: 4a-hydroxytetrahydrobiopterin dehydratase [Asticcacaulis sp.]|nr:4a-hydroxytetrahydrobiopterin dehydratase [Asticcacaulis sp.]
MQKFSAHEAAQQVAALDGWRLEAGAGAITRDFRFADFRTAWAFMTAVAAVADRLDHHPEWSNIYNQVSIRLTTHDAGGLTARDMTLARCIADAADRAVK